MNKLFLNSLPKSGTHLICKLLDQMGREFSNVNFSSSTIYGRHSIPKSILRGALFGQPCIEVGLDIATAVRLSWANGALKGISGKGYCGGHAPYSDGLYTLLKNNGFRTIHIIRDPRDVLLSWVHYVPKNSWHYGCQGLESLSLEERVRKVLYGYSSGAFVLESFPNILKRSSGWLEKEDVLVIRFEDLVGSKGGGDDQKQVDCIREVASFIGVSSFDAVKISSELFGGTKVFRKGKIGSFKDELSVGLLNEVNICLEQELIQMGYKV